MTTTFRKVEGQLEVSETISQKIIPQKVEVKKYQRDFLDKQKIAVEEDLANVISRHKQELAVAQANVSEVNTLILEAQKLGLTTKPIADSVII